MLIVLGDCFSADKIRIFLCRLVESGNLDALPVSYCSIIPFFFFLLSRMSPRLMRTSRLPINTRRYDCALHSQPLRAVN